MSPSDRKNPSLPTETNYDPCVPPTEQLARWILHLEPERKETVKVVTAEIWEEMSRTTGQPNMTPATVCRSIRARLRPRFVDDLLPKCASWTGRETSWSGVNDASVVDAVFESVEGVRALLAPGSATNVSSAAPYRWLIPCVFGGVAGMLFLGNSDSILAAFGALLGSAGAVAGVAYLSQNEEVRARTVSHHDSSLDVRPPIACSHRNHSLFLSPKYWLLSKCSNMGITLAARLVDYIFPSDAKAPGIPRAKIPPAVEQEFDSFATLAFVLCAVCQVNEQPGVQVDAGLRVTENSIHHALTVLVRYLDKDPEDLETIRDMALELQQRLQDEGYAWQVLPDGEPFREEFRQAFRLFGLIESGQPVQTLEPSFSHRGIVILPGRITRQRAQAHG